MTSLRDEARRMAKEAADNIAEPDDLHVSDADIIKSAILAFAKLVLEREPSDKKIADLIFDMIKHGDEAHQGWLRLKSYKVAQALRAELLRELTEEEPK